MRLARTAVVVAAFVWLVPTPPAAAATTVQTAALQVALRAHGDYHGTIDGIAGPQTRAAIRAFQRQKGLRPDGVLGPRTRAALGPLGRPLFGSRPLRRGSVGWDVSVLQFRLRRRGLAVGDVDGRFGGRTATAVRRFQGRAGLVQDGIAGPATFAALVHGDVGARRSRPADRGVLRSGLMHVVRAGETLSAIAGRYATSVAALARANGLDPARVLPVAARLRLPRSRSGPPAGPPSARSPSARVVLDRWANHYGIDPRLLRALAWQESGFQNHVVSAAGAFGVMQVTHGTWRYVEEMLLGRRIPRTLEGNVRVGTAFLAYLLRLFRGDERLALAAYYRGPAAVQQHGIGPETRRYVENVLALRRRM